MEHYFLDLSIPQILALSQNLSLYTADQIILDYVITQQVTTPEQVVTYLNERGYSQYSVEDVKSTFQDFKITQQADGTYKPDTTKTPLSETHIQEAKWRLANKKMQSLADFVYVESLRHTLDGQKLKGGGKYTVNFDYPKLTQHFATLGLNIDQDVIIRSCNQHEFQFSDKTIWKPKAYYSYKLFKLISTNSYAPIKDAATLTLAISIIEDHASVESLAKAVSERYGQNVSVETTKQLLIQLEIIKTNGGNYKPIFLAKHSLSRMDKSHIRFWLSNEKLVSVQQFIINETKRVLGLGKDIDILAIREQLTSYGVNIDTDTINTTVKESKVKKRIEDTKNLRYSIV